MVEATTAFSIILDGEWNMERAAQLGELVRGILADILAAAPPPARAEIDMAAVTDVDACGCQLLAVFLDTLRQRAVTPIPCGIAPQIMDRIALLGFHGTFFPEQFSGKEAA